MADKFNPDILHGVGFHDARTNRWMRYIYPDAKHWTAGWIMAQNPSGEWMTWRKATDEDIKAINGAVVKAHHPGEEVA